MNDESKAPLSKNSPITIGFAIVVFSAIIGFLIFDRDHAAEINTRIIRLEEALNAHVRAPNIHEAGFAELEAKIISMEDKLVRKDVLQDKLENIQLQLDQIQNFLIKEKEEKKR